jgi:hypothetical protein
MRSVVRGPLIPKVPDKRQRCIGRAFSRRSEIVRSVRRAGGFVLTPLSRTFTFAM